MCQHFWKIDSMNKGVCKDCGKVKDFQPGIDKAFGYTDKFPVKGLDLKRSLCTVGAYYMQGGFHQGGYAFGNGIDNDAELY